MDKEIIEMELDTLNEILTRLVIKMIDIENKRDIKKLIGKESKLVEKYDKQLKEMENAKNFILERTEILSNALYFNKYYEK